MRLSAEHALLFLLSLLRGVKKKRSNGKMGANAAYAPRPHFPPPIIRRPATLSLSSLSVDGFQQHNFFWRVLSFNSIDDAADAVIGVGGLMKLIN
jgi:hypothetical protein